jgi:hypothetical protein
MFSVWGGFFVRGRISLLCCMRWWLRILVRRGLLLGGEGWRRGTNRRGAEGAERERRRFGSWRFCRHLRGLFMGVGIEVATVLLSLVEIQTEGT